MVEPFEHSYFNWLYAKVCDVHEEDPAAKYEQLLSIFHRHPFEWFVVGDDNRVEEGLDLREEFKEVTGLASDTDDQCSVLECLVAFARKIGSTSGLPSIFWFWTMIENLGMANMNDAYGPDEVTTHEALDIFVNRHYDELGHGGIFPLRESEYDQRYIELWYQFNEYSYQNNIV